MECFSSTENKSSEQGTWNAEQSINQPKPFTELELNDLTRDVFCHQSIHSAPRIMTA